MAMARKQYLVGEADAQNGLRIWGVETDRLKAEEAAAQLPGGKGCFIEAVWPETTDQSQQKQTEGIHSETAFRRERDPTGV